MKLLLTSTTLILSYIFYIPSSEAQLMPLIKTKEIKQEYVYENSEEKDHVLKYYKLSPCSHWSYLNSSSGSGYLCQNYGNIDSPELSSLVNILNAYDEKLIVLESRIKILEQRILTK